MSKFAEARQNMLDEAREQAEKLTKRRLQDDGFDFHAEKENAINSGVAVGDVVTPSEEKAKGKK